MSLQLFDVTLTPTGRFFFGGEVIFGQKGDEERRRSYLVKSRILPQQTSLLGMLRYEILRATHQLGPYRSGAAATEAAKLVGQKGFTLNSANDWGAVVALSPLLLYDGTQKWYPQPADTDQGDWQRVAGRYWQLAGLNPKQPPALSFAPMAGKSQPTETLFTAQTITGNRISNRHYRGKSTAGDPDEGLFRQTFLRNHNTHFPTSKGSAATQFSFRFRVAINTDILGADAGAMLEEIKAVTLGGEKSRFTCQIDSLGAAALTEEAAATELAAFARPPALARKALPAGYARIVFLSDVFLPPEVGKRTDTFLLANARPFRFLTTVLDDQLKVANLYHRNESKVYHLLERGGLLLVPVGDAATITQQINTHQPFRRIGYNYCAHV